MSGVIGSMRRTLLSCISLARNGLILLGATALGSAIATSSAYADEMTVLNQISNLFELNHQEFAVLTTALALLGFSVVAAILLMRTRVRAAKKRGATAFRHPDACRSKPTGSARCCSPNRKS